MSLSRPRGWQRNADSRISLFSVTVGSKEGPLRLDSSIDNNLIRKAAGGDESALNELVGLIWPRLHAAARRDLGEWLRGIEGSEDIVNSACRQVFVQLRDQVDNPPKNVVAWFFQAVRRKVHDRARFHMAEERDARRVREWDDALAFEGYKSFSSPSEAAGQKEAMAAVDRCLERLGDRQREVVLQTMLLMRTRTEVAEELQCSPDAVKVMLYRALARLRGMLRQEGHSAI